MLHDLAKSVRNGTVPSAPRSWAFLNVRPVDRERRRAGDRRVEADRPVVEQAERADHLERRAGRHLRGERQVEPAPPPGPLATASTAPSLIRIATMAERRVSPASAPSAAFCVGRVERGLQRRARPAGARLEQRPSSAGACTATPGDCRAAGRRSAACRPARPDQVADLVLARVLVDDLLGDRRRPGRAAPARTPGRRQRLRRLAEHRARQALQLRCGSGRSRPGAA